jgi:hypothetical protein
MSRYRKGERASRVCLRAHEGASLRQKELSNEERVGHKAHPQDYRRLRINLPKLMQGCRSRFRQCFLASPVRELLFPVYDLIWPGT